MTTPIRAAWVLAAALTAGDARAAAAPAAKAPMAGLTDSSEMRVSAECGPEGSKERISYRCADGRSAQVEITLGDLHIWADAVDFLDTHKTDAKGGTRRVDAKGNVVFMRGEERISGDTLEMDLDTGKGVLTNARGYVQPGVFFEAARLERVAATT